MKKKEISLPALKNGSMALAQVVLSIREIAIFWKSGREPARAGGILGEDVFF